MILVILLLMNGMMMVIELLLQKVSKGYERRESAHNCRHRLFADYGPALIVKKEDNLWFVFLRIKET